MKAGLNRRKSSISTVCKGSIRVSYGVCTSFSSSTNSRRWMVVPLRTKRVNDGGITEAHDATTIGVGRGGEGGGAARP